MANDPFDEHIGSRIRIALGAMEISFHDAALRLDMSESSLRRKAAGTSPTTAPEILELMNLTGRKFTFFFPTGDELNRVRGRS